MKQSKCAQQQSYTLKQAVSSTLIDVVCRKLGFSQQTFYGSKKLAGCSLSAGQLQDESLGRFEAVDEVLAFFNENNTPK